MTPNAKSIGRLIVFEGIDGAGKTTQIKLLEAHLRRLGREVLCTAEPTDSASGRMLRAALSGADPRTGCEMAAMFLLDRIHHNVDPENGLAYHLARGTDIICDRYYYSSMAYQGSETDAAWVRDLNLCCPEIRRPELCIFLDLTPEESMARIDRGRETKEIYETTERLTRVREQFFRVFQDLRDTDRIAVVDASGSVEEVHARVCAALQDAGIE